MLITQKVMRLPNCMLVLTVYTIYTGGTRATSKSSLVGALLKQDFHDLMAAYLKRAAADNVVRAGKRAEPSCQVCFDVSVWYKCPAAPETIWSITAGAGRDHQYCHSPAHVSSRQAIHDTGVPMCAEIFFDPQSHTSRGVAWETMLNGFHSAMQVPTCGQLRVLHWHARKLKRSTNKNTFRWCIAQEAQQQHGISTDLIMCFLRHEGAEPAWQTLQEVSSVFNLVTLLSQHISMFL